MNTSLIRILSAYMFVIIAIMLMAAGEIGYIIAVFIIAIPMIISSLTRTTERKKAKIRDFKDQFLTRPIRVSRIGGYLAGIILCTAIALVVTVMLFLSDFAELLTIMILVTVAIALSVLFKNITFYKPEHADYHNEWKKHVIIFAIGTILYPVIWLFCSDTLGLSIPLGNISMLSSIPIAYEIGLAVDTLNTITDKMLVTAESGSFIFLLIVYALINGGMVFEALFRYGEAFIMPANRICKAFMPIGIKQEYIKSEVLSKKLAVACGTPLITEEVMNNSSKKNKAKNMNSRILLVSIVTIVLIITVFCTGNILSNLGITNTVETLSSGAVEAVDYAIEIINGATCRPGTYNQIAEAGNMISAEAETEAITAVNAYYDEMIANTDAYLDWYYSFGGQWSQIGNMAKGFFADSITDTVENYMVEKMEAYISPSSDISMIVSDIYTKADVAFKEAAANIISDNTVSYHDGRYIVCLEKSLDEIAAECRPEKSLNPLISAGVGVVGGTVTGILVKNVIKKAMANTVSKLAVKSASKAVVPAAVGSLAGPVGTFAGILAGVGFDYLMNKSDEAFNRTDYKKAIIDSINADRRECISQISAYENIFN